MIVFWKKLADVSEVLTASILIMEAESTSLLSASFYRNTRYKFQKWYNCYNMCRENAVLIAWSEALSLD